ncbi:hypothetical protein MFRU_004g02900 [Monilinia fructicola]|nr:hypothetical protein MFRU_004g02900 [Monilinia fructicola]
MCFQRHIINHSQNPATHLKNSTERTKALQASLNHATTTLPPITAPPGPKMSHEAALISPAAQAPTPSLFPPLPDKSPHYRARSKIT